LPLILQFVVICRDNHLLTVNVLVVVENYEFVIRILTLSLIVEFIGGHMHIFVFSGRIAIFGCRSLLQELADTFSI